jgi:hypothetical protein
MPDVFGRPIPDPFPPEEEEIVMTIGNDEVELVQGQYWRALKAIPAEKIPEGMVLLLESIRDVDGTAHTIILRAHPSRMLNYGPKEHRFLVADFLRKFVLEPNYARIRQQEVAQLQARIGELQEELVQADTAPPASLRGHLTTGIAEWEKQKQLPSGAAKALATTQIVPLTTSLQAEQVETMKLAAEHHHQMATLKSDWIKARVETIGETVAAMTPYFQEQAAAALAKTEDVRRYVSKLQSGIESLDLYVGTGVYVHRLSEGASAPADLPLTVVQRKLYADEELSVFANIDETFDHSQIETFFEKLAESEGLRNQIFPAQRCIVAYAATRREIDYKDIWANGIRNAENRKVGLLIRDGENLFVVISPIDTHLRAHNLFPGRAELDNIFRENVGWWEQREGKVGREITFNDVKYTDKLSEHEAFSLHYKRFMILLAGLDHREQLFGPFYEGPQGMDFISLPFQQKHMRFIHDDDGEFMLPGLKLKPLQEWINEKNAYLRSGARVLGAWRTVMTPQSAPGAVEDGGSSSHYYHFKASPMQRYSVEIAREDAGELVVSVPVKRTSYGSSQEFKARVSITKYHEYAIGYLVLDAVKADEMERYIYDREARKDHLSYIQFFKHAAAHLREVEEHERLSRDFLKKALVDGGIANGDEADVLVDRAVIAWRAENRGADLPHFTTGSDPAWASLLNHMYTQVNSATFTSDAATWADNEGLEPLRLVVTGKNKLRLYCAPKPEERDDRLTPHVWVHAVDFTTKLKTGDLKRTGQHWVELPQFTAQETTLHEWSGAETWSTLTSPITFEEKQALFELTTKFEERLAFYRNPENAATFYQTWRDIRRKMNMKSRSVQDPILAIPFGVAYTDTYGKGAYHLLCLTHSSPHGLIYQLAQTPDVKEGVRSTFIATYANKSFAREQFSKGEGGYWSLGVVGERNFKGELEMSWTNSFGSYHRSNPSLTARLERGIREWTKNRNKDAILAPGDLNLDQILGLDTRVKKFRVEEESLRGDKRTETLHTLYTIFPVDENGDAIDYRQDHEQILSYCGGISYAEKGYFYTREEAREYLTSKLGAEPLIEPIELVPVNPEIERWTRKKEFED